MKIQIPKFKVPPLGRAVIEILLICALCFFCFWHYPELRGYMDLNPSPLLILGIAISLRYSFFQALSGQLLLTAISLSIKWQSGSFLDTDDLLQFQNLYTPILNLGLCLWLSLSKTEIQLKFSSLDREHQDLSEENQDLRHALDCRTETLDELSDRLSERGENWTALQEFGQQMLIPERSAQIEAMIKLCSHLLGTKDCAWYTATSSGELELEFGSTEQFPPECNTHIGLAALALQRGGLLTIADLDPRELGEEDLQLALGVWNAEQNFEGVLVAKEIPFARLHRENMRIIKISSHWFHLALKNAKRWSAMESASIWNPEDQCYNLFYLEQHIDQAFANCRRYGSTFALCQIKFQYQDGHLPSLHAIEAHLLRQFLRTGDIMAHDEKQNSWWIYLPSTPGSGAEIALDKLSQQLANFFQDSTLEPLAKFRVCEWQKGMEPIEMWAQCSLE